jgi:hypothetical protein
MIEVIETIEIEGSEEPLATAYREGTFAYYRRLLFPFSADRPDGSHCGHIECWAKLTIGFEMSLN